MSNSIKKKKKKKVESNKELTPYEKQLDGFIFDKSEIREPLHLAQGFFKGHFYFGQMIPKRISITDKNGNFVKEIQQLKPAIITAEHLLYGVDGNFEQQHNVQFSDNLLVDKSRWQLDEIKNFKEHSGRKLREDYPVATPQEIFMLVRGQYEKYYSTTDKRYYDVRAIWDIGTYWHTIFDAYPYIENNGLKGTGKTKVMRISALISFNAKEFINPSEASLFRFTQLNLPTLYFDEAENIFGKNGNENILQLLNAGWQKGTTIPRVEKDKSGKFKVMLFNAYCPKQFATIKGISSNIALKDRCILEVFVKARKEDKRGDLWADDNDKTFSEIRNKLHSFALKCASEVEFYYRGQGEIKKEFNLTNRDWQIWKPLLVIAKLISNELYQTIGKFAEELTELKGTEGFEEDSWDYKILISVREFFKGISQNEKKDLKIGEVKKLMSFEDKEKKPSNAYIGKFLNRIGFSKFRKRTGKDGVFYKMSDEDFQFILLSQNITLKHTQVTQLTQKPPEEEIIGVSNGVSSVSNWCK